MKKLLVSAILSLLLLVGNGQKLELRPTVYSGFYFYRGSAAVSTSNFYFGDDIGYYNPTSYGKESDFSYAFELQTQYVTKFKLIVGVGVSYEKLASRAIIDSFYGSFFIPSSASGKVTITNTYITVNPFLGYRFLAGPVSFDALAGVEWAHHQNDPVEKATLTSPNRGTEKLKKPIHPTDLRHRVHVSTTYKRMGVSIGYSRGTKNQYYYNNPNFREKKAYANFIRLGISYKLI